MASRFADSRPQPADDHAPLTSAAIASLRARQVGGSRGVSCCAGRWASASPLVAVEWTAGLAASCGRPPRAGARRSGSGRMTQLLRNNPGLPIAEGFPAYVPEARAFVMTLDPAAAAGTPGIDETGDGTALERAGAVAASARTSAAGRTRASRTSGSTARATSRATTGSGSSPAGAQYGPADRSHGSAIRPRSTTTACSRSTRRG